MLKKAVLNHRALSIIIAVVIVGVAGFLIVNIAHANDHSSKYSVNSEGLTYGSAADATSPETEPDLVLVQATNGKTGYAYSSDLRAASGEAANPEEAVQLMKDRSLRATNAFVSSIKDQTGIDISTSKSNVKNALDTIIQEDVPFSSLTSTEQTTLKKALPSNIANDVVASAWEKACEANQSSVPVYDKDGKTVIGEFIVG